jgi:hypothetical protein
MKYPRTLHLPWSSGTSDDKISKDVSSLLNVEIVVLEKMDGSNSSLEMKGCFARTHAGPPNHPSFDGLKALHAAKRHLIPANFQLFGEWLFAKHSIAYDKLPAYFMLFNARCMDIPERLIDPTFTCAVEWFAWDEVELWADEIGVPTVPVLFKGKVSSEKELKELTLSLMKENSLVGNEREGVVVRVARSFNDEEFSRCVMKFVRKDHVQTGDHWSHKKIVRNKLK